MKHNAKDSRSLKNELREQGDENASQLSIVIKTLLTRPRKKLILYIRLMEYLRKRGRLRLASLVSAHIYHSFSCYISPLAEIGYGVLFAHPVGVVIGQGAMVGDNCIIFQNVTIGKGGLAKDGYPKVGNNVVLYSGSQVIGDIQIADCVSVGSLSLVNKDIVDAGVTVVGIPARVVQGSKNDI